MNGYYFELFWNRFWIFSFFFCERCLTVSRLKDWDSSASVKIHYVTNTISFHFYIFSLTHWSSHCVNKKKSENIQYIQDAMCKKKLLGAKRGPHCISHSRVPMCVQCDVRAHKKNFKEKKNEKYINDIQSD